MKGSSPMDGLPPLEGDAYYVSKCNDRRKYQRLNLNINVVYRVDSPMYVRITFGSKEIEAVTLNLGEGGMAILTEQDIPLWTILAMKFRLIRMDKEGKVDYSEPVEMCGEVRSNNIFENQDHRLGISFVHKDTAIRNRIGDFVIKTVEL
jgi:c-di-GMP-binding flagellar brake protein YcgR